MTGVTHHVHFFKQDHSVPVRAPPTEAAETELDESSGHQSWTEATPDPRGQDQSGLPVPEPLKAPLSFFNLLPGLKEICGEGGVMSIDGGATWWCARVGAEVLACTGIQKPPGRHGDGLLVGLVQVRPSPGCVDLRGEEQGPPHPVDQLLSGGLQWCFYRKPAPQAAWGLVFILSAGWCPAEGLLIPPGSFLWFHP